MKKILIATSALVATAGVAAADVTLSGYGRFGLDYNSKAAVDVPKSQVNMRMRVNIDAKTETDSGVSFGGRIRMQYSSGTLNGLSSNGTTSLNATSGASLNAAQLYATYNGMRVEVGNANTAIDSVALMYNSEIGYLDRSMGDPIGSFTAYQSTPYATDLIAPGQDQSTNRMGVFTSYSISGMNIRASLINPNQSTSAAAYTLEKEVSVSADYNFGQFTVAAAYADNSGFAKDATSAFIGAEYAINSDANVGLLHFRENDGLATATSKTNRTTIYGNYKMDAMTFKGYVAHDTDTANLTKTAFGLGMDYDLGGARLSGDIHRGYKKETVAGLGVRFNF